MCVFLIIKISMKKILIILTILFSVLTCSYAQVKKEEKYGCAFVLNNIYTPMGLIGDATIGLSTDGFWNRGGERNDNSYSISIIPKYFLNKDLFVRIEFGITKIDEYKTITVSSTSGAIYSSTYPISNETIEQKSNSYIPGIQWNVFTDTKIGMHIGVSLPYNHYSDLIYNGLFNIRNTATDTLISSNKISITVPGGYSLGIGAVAGFDFYLLKNISVGAEFSNAFIYYNIGGNVTNVYNYLFPSSNSGEAITPEYYKGMRLEKIFSSFNITINI